MALFWNGYGEKTKTKKVTLFILATFLVGLLGMMPPLVANEQPVKVFVNGTEIAFDVQPYIDKNGRTMIPLRFILEQLDCEVTWNGAQQEILVNQRDKQMRLWINKPTAQVDGVMVSLDTVPVLRNGRTMVPLRFIAENFGANVVWNGQTKSVAVTYSPGTTATNQQGVVTLRDVTSRVNLRSGPGTNFDVIDRLNHGTVVNVMGKSNNWLQVVMSNQRQGWLASEFVTVREAPVESSRDDSSIRDREPDTEQQDEIVPDEGAIPNDPALNGLTAINSVTATTSHDSVVLTINGNANFSFTTSMLEQPARYVVDINNAYLSQELLGNPTISINQSPVNQFRIGQFTNSTVRIVADLNSFARVENSVNNSNQISFSFREASGNLAGKTIVIDPGHGSIQPGGWLDPGAVGPTGLHERVVALDISLKLARILENQGANVILTHTGSTSLSLAERAQIANDNNAAMFVSIHANANVNRNINGTMTFYHNGGPNAWNNQQLARSIQSQLVKQINRQDLGIATANFSVLRNSQVPAVLVETAFISNPQEEKLLADANFRTKCAEGIANGIIHYLSR